MCRERGERETIEEKGEEERKKRSCWQIGMIRRATTF